MLRQHIAMNGGVAPVRAHLDTLLPRVPNGTLHPGAVFDRELPPAGAAQACELVDTRRATKAMLLP